MGPYTEDKYFYVVQGCFDCAAVSCYYPLQDKIVERINHEEPQQIPIDIRNDVRLSISKTMLVFYPHEGIDQHNLLVTEGVKRNVTCNPEECPETCNPPKCRPEAETYYAWYITARTAFWYPNSAQKWHDSGKSETFQCIWDPYYTDNKFPIAISRVDDVWADYINVIDEYNEITNLSDEEVWSMAHVR